MNTETARFIVDVLAIRLADKGTAVREAQDCIVERYRKVCLREPSLTAHEANQKAGAEWLEAYLADWRPPVTVVDTTHCGD